MGRGRRDTVGKRGDYRERERDYIYMLARAEEGMQRRVSLRDYKLHTPTNTNTHIPRFGRGI